MARVLLEDSWQAQDIVDYCAQNAIRCDVVSANVLKQMKARDFLKQTYFCSTEIVQQHLQTVGHEDFVPDTYEKAYDQFFCRPILRSTLKEVDFTGGPRFVKPVGNCKEFEGTVIASLSDFIVCPSLFCDVYNTAPIYFVSEYRLLIGNGRLYGLGHMCKALVEQMDACAADGLDQIAQELVIATGNGFRCIDVGLAEKTMSASSAKWIVVEINPPFSLDDYGIPLPQYMSFCIDACAYIAREIEKKRLP